MFVIPFRMGGSKKKRSCLDCKGFHKYPWGPNMCIYMDVGFTNMLVSKNTKICVTPNMKHKICVTPNTKPQREPMEYRLCWVPKTKFSLWPCTFHVVCVHFIPSLQWNMGLKDFYKYVCIYIVLGKMSKHQCLVHYHLISYLIV